jgi:hypothetical protein
MERTQHVLDLFAGLGGFSAAFEESDRWGVTTVEIEERFNPDIQADVMDLRPADLPDADVVLASPPCTVFSIANQPSPHFDGDRPTSAEARESIALVYHTIGLIRAINPDYWVLENPRGKLRAILGQPTGTINYCQYGYDWQKPTDLWGEHPPGFEYRTCPPGAGCHQAGEHGWDTGEKRKHFRDPAERAKVPYGVSEAILNAVEGRCEQTTLDGVKA